MLEKFKHIGFLLLALFILSGVTGCPDRPEDKSPDDEIPAPEPELPICETPGLHLVYTVNDPRLATLGNADNAHVLIAESDGSRREVLFTFPGFIFHTVPSPTGTHIAVVGSVPNLSGTDERHLFIYDIRTGRFRDVSEGGYYTRMVTTSPVFTRDGSAVLFISRRADDYPLYNIFRCEISSGQVRGLYTQSVEEVPVELTPDGRHCIAVRRVPDRSGVREFISINIESGAETIIHTFENVTKVGPACMTSDGGTIFCDLKPSDEGSSAGSGARSRELWSINLETDTATRLLDPATVTYIYQVFIDSGGSERLLLRRQEDLEGEDTPIARIATCLPDGSDFRYLTEATERSYLFGPPPKNTKHISPDNSLIFYYSQDPVFKHEDIWVMSPDGSNPVNISNTAGYGEGSAGWIQIPY